MKTWLKKAATNFWASALMGGSVLVALIYTYPSLAQMIHKAPEASPVSLEGGKLMNAAEMAKMHGIGRHPDPQLETATQAIQDYFIQRYSDPTGPHVESVLSSLGAVSGFGCQMAIREAFIKTGKVPESQAFVVVATKDGKRYYFGDFLNQPLLDTKQYSVWTLVAGGAIKAGATVDSLPDITKILKHNASTVGGAEFGIPQLPAEHFPKELPSDALRATWQDVETILKKHEVDPRFWGWVPATAAQRVIIKYKDKIAPPLAAKIVMESALPMSKMDPVTALAEK